VIPPLRHNPQITAESGHSCGRTDTSLIWQTLQTSLRLSAGPTHGVGRPDTSISAGEVSR